MRGDTSKFDPVLKIDETFYKQAESVWEDSSASYAQIH